MKLTDKIALVTGSSSGIGEAVAKRLAEEGATVAVVASSQLDKAQSVVDKVTRDMGNAKAFVGNVADVDSVKSLVKNVVESFGTIDILVNAAGVYYPTLIGQTSVEQFDRMVNINIRGTFFTIDRVAPIMMSNENGKIVNFSSVAAFVASKEYGLYSATKAAITTLTKTFALQLAPYGINVNAIAPGNTATPLNENIRTQPEFAERRAMIDRTTPSRRKFSDPEDMANAVLFLVGDDSLAMHGATMNLDEGRSAGI